MRTLKILLFLTLTAALAGCATHMRTQRASLSPRIPAKVHVRNAPAHSARVPTPVSAPALSPATTPVVVAPVPATPAVAAKPKKKKIRERIKERWNFFKHIF